MMLENLFKFPIIMVDGNKEEEKEREMQRLALDSGPREMDIIVGEAECPYTDFVSVSDRWLPSNEESFQNALKGKFDACSVYFFQSGTFLVPWTKSKFKEKLKKFIDSLPEKDESSNIKILSMTKDQFLEKLKSGDDAAAE